MNILFNPDARLPQTEIDHREAVCREVIASASALAMEGFRNVVAGGVVTMKGPQDFLTEYDRMVEDHIRTRLRDAFPTDGFLGEEGDPQLAPRLWVVDPIDGTANFARGIPHFAISIAFVDQGRTEIGSIANPATGETWRGRRGRGAERDGRPIRAAGTSEMDCASIEFGWSTRIDNAVYVERFAALLATGANVRRLASGALALAFVADGRSDGYVELHINAWDCLAGLLLAEEAGAKINPFLEKGGLLNGNPIIAVSAGIADIVSKAAGIPLT